MTHHHHIVTYYMWRAAQARRFLSNLAIPELSEQYFLGRAFLYADFA